MSEAWVAVQALVQRYAVLVDQRDLDAVADLFTDDAELVLPDVPRSLAPVRTVRGRAGIRAELGSVRSTVATRHGVLAVALDPDGHGATVTGVAQHLMVHDDRLVDRVWHLRYRDRYEVTDRWRFARRELCVDWTESRPVDRDLAATVRRPA